MATQNLDKGFVVKTYPAPPASFDFGKATDEERATYGIPKLPAGLREVADRLMAKRQKFRYIEPVFKPRDRMRKSLPKVDPAHGDTSNIWSGAVVFPPAKDQMDGVWATWKMPDDSLPSGAKDGITYTASTWVGIDGWGSGDVVQTGCDADVTKSGGTTQHQFNPWWEWWPGGSFWLTSVAVAKGDELNAMVIAVPGPPVVAIVQLINFTQFSFSFFEVTPPPHVTLEGNCAEWILEALETGPHKAPELGKYSTVKFTECGAHTLGDKVVTATGGTVINMTDTGGKVISKGKIVSSTEVEVSYV